MQPRRIREQIGFYQKELTNNLLSFWLPRCEDREHGGYWNCFDNTGRTLVSRDKYLWSQGRFVWLFARLATMQGDVFTQAQRAEFIRLARNGRDFLIRHSLIAPDDWRCVFLTDTVGRPKLAAGTDRLDSSFFADCFVAAGLARYALAAEDDEAYHFAWHLYQSILDRVAAGDYQTQPYPLPEGYRAHSIPMILSNLTAELQGAAERFDPTVVPSLRERLNRLAEEILDHFVDDRSVLHEVIDADNQPVDGLLGQHANPGHALEDLWFLFDSADRIGTVTWRGRLAEIAAAMLEIGWDRDYGGLLHYCDVDGGRPRDLDTVTDDSAPLLRQVRDGWGDKLWWVHSEALYTSLLCYHETGESRFLDWYDRLFDYTFTTFPNPNREIREWVQIRGRDGIPHDQVVALPVKDPYHIIRNIILLLELLQQMEHNEPR